MKVLGINDFFYVPHRVYDDSAERALPHYHEAHQKLVQALSFDRERPLEFLDLGVGSGVTSAYLLRNFPNSRITGIDLFSEMLEDARARLATFEGRVTLVQAENSEFLQNLDGKVDAIVSAFCIHHQDDDGKKELFSLVYDHLVPGGLFLMLDLTTFHSPHLRKLSRQKTIDHMMAHVNDEEFRREWIYHWNNKNTPSSADSMVAWLAELGFSAETVYRDFEVTLICSRRG